MFHHAKSPIFNMIIIFLVLIISTEIAFYLGLLNSNNRSNAKNQNPIQKQIISYSEVTNSLRRKMIKEGVLTSNVNISEVTSKIKEINFKGGFNMDEPYTIKIVLEVGTNDEVSYFFNKNDLSKTKIVKISSQKELPIKVEELKVGDKITIFMKYDFTKSIESAAIEIKIIKIT